MTRSRSDFALTGACVFSRLSRCMAGGGNHAREQIANANGITASTWPKMPFRKPLSFQYRPYGGNDRKTTFAETECGILSQRNFTRHKMNKFKHFYKYTPPPVSPLSPML
jgi:hypothetical protein